VIYILYKYKCLYQLVVIRDLLFVLLFIINRSFILFIVRLFVLFSFSSIPYLFIVQKRKSNSDPEPCSGISIPLTVTCYLVPVQVPVIQHHHLELINIIQQTPPTLS
jgi:hypothetical protein